MTDKKPLKRIKNDLFHFVNEERKEGANSGLSGNCSELSGNCSELRGDCSELRGDCSELSGNFSGLSGDLTEIKKRPSKLEEWIDDETQQK